MLLDVYGHFLPREMHGHADRLQPIANEATKDLTRPNQGVAG